MEDFYGLGAFFADLKEPIVGAREEGMPVLSEEQNVQLERLKKEAAEARAAFEAILPELDKAQKAWEEEVLASEERQGEIQTMGSTANQKKEAQQVSEYFRKKKSGTSVKEDTKSIALLAHFYRTHVTKEYEPERTRLDRAERAVSDFLATVPKCIVSVPSEMKRTVRILPRGNWMDESGEIMKPRIPTYLNQSNSPPNRELNRVDLAQWLVDRSNPLTARAFMNRLWKQFFGLGLSRYRMTWVPKAKRPPTHNCSTGWLASSSTLAGISNTWSV